MMYGGEMDYSGPRIFGASLRLFTAVPLWLCLGHIHRLVYILYNNGRDRAEATELQAIRDAVEQP